MKSIMISIRPEWTAKILNGIKTIEVRKTAPKCELPIEVYIYCTKGNHIGHLSNRYVGKVVAKFTLREVEEIVLDPFGYYAIKESNQVLIDQECWICETCITNVDLAEYLKGKVGYAWHISDLVIFDRPKELSEFDSTYPNGIVYVGPCALKGIKYPPCSWCYCEERYPGATVRKIEPPDLKIEDYKNGSAIVTDGSKKFLVDGDNLYDLTAAFGKGNEPTSIDGKVFDLLKKPKYTNGN